MRSFFKAIEEKINTKLWIKKKLNPKEDIIQTILFGVGDTCSRWAGWQ